MIEFEGPLVNSQFYAPTAGKEDERLTSGSFKCTCTLFDGLPCSTRYSTAELLEMRMHHLSMTREELDIIALVKLSTAIHVDPTTTASKQKPNQRKKIRSQYRHEGHNICRESFMFMHEIFKDRLTTLLKHYQENGASPRVHGNKGNQPVHALSSTDCQRVVDFIFNYAEKHAVLLPGQIPGYRRDDLKLLPSSVSKASLHRICCDA